MTKLTKNIYYANQHILNTIESDFECVDSKDWYTLYQYTIDNSYWRLNKRDKYQVQFFVKLESREAWEEFDATTLKIELLKLSRGTTNQKCIWKDCHKNTLVKMKICEFHAYTEMGIRK